MSQAKLELAKLKTQDSKKPLKKDKILTPSWNRQANQLALYPAQDWLQRNLGKGLLKLVAQIGADGIGPTGPGAQVPDLAPLPSLGQSAHRPLPSPCPVLLPPPSLTPWASQAQPALLVLPGLDSDAEVVVRGISMRCPTLF